MNNRQSDTKTTKQIRIDSGLHKLLKVKASKAEMTLRDFLEQCLNESDTFNFEDKEI